MMMLTPDFSMRPGTSANSEVCDGRTPLRLPLEVAKFEDKSS